ncbi:MAG: BatD family protein [Bacteroidia bacterium]
MEKFSSLLLFLLCFTAQAQEISFKVSASSTTMAVGERFRLTYTVNANASGFESPDLSNFNVYSGPNQSSNVQMMNGSFTQSLSYYYILSPKTEGVYKIGPAAIRIGNGRISSNEITITVGKSNSSNQNQGSQAANQAQPNSDNAGDKIFIKAIVNKSKVNLSESVSVTYKIFSKYNQINFSDLKFPTFNGFYTEEIPMGKNDKLEVEQYNGSNWYTAELKKSLLFPQKSGKLEIPALEATCLVRERVQSQNFFDQFFGGGYKDIQVKVKSKPYELDVQSFPTTAKPADFQGAVGKFDIDASVDKSDVKSGDAITLTFKISGNGNLKLIEAPSFVFPAEFESYDPQIKDNIRVSESGMSGSREFSYLLIARAGGKYQFGPFTYSYFSAEKSKYISETIAAIDINVKKSAGDPVIAGRSGSSSAPKKISSDIRFIKVAETDLKDLSESPFFLSGPFYLLSSLPPLGLILLLLVRQRKTDRKQNQRFYRKKEAGGMAQKRLKKAGELLKQSKKEEFYEEVFRALYGYLSDKLLIPTAQLSKDKIAGSLNEKKVAAADIAELERILNQCEFARYAPGAEMKMSEFFEETKTLIVALEKYLK